MVKVGVRVRPSWVDTNSVASRKTRDEEPIIQTDVNNQQVLISQGDKSFQFDHIFDESRTQSDIFTIVKPLLSKVMEGSNVCVLAYGQTGSGKTYTMGTGKILNTESNDDGIVPRIVRELFRSENISDCIISVSFLEVYNENIFDLLGHSNAKLSLREDGTGIKLPDLTEHVVNSTEAAFHYINCGVEARTTATTAYNIKSSRSHALVCINVDRRDESKCRSTIRLVDLAGSEAVHKAEAGSSIFKEGININTSLLALGNVIQALNREQGHIPYRSSILTRLLQDSFCGDCTTLMIACVCSTESQLAETINTLRYAERAKGIINRPSYASTVKKRKLNNQGPERTKLVRNLNSAFKQSLGSARYKTARGKSKNSFPSPATRGLEKINDHVLSMQHRSTNDDLTLIASPDNTIINSICMSSTPSKTIRPPLFSITPMVTQITSRLQLSVRQTIQSAILECSRVDESSKTTDEHGVVNDDFNFKVPATVQNYSRSLRCSQYATSTKNKQDLHWNDQSRIAAFPPSTACAGRRRSERLAKRYSIQEKENFSFCESTPDFAVTDKEILPASTPGLFTACARILPSPVRGWKIQLDPSLQKQNNRRVMQIVNTANHTKLMTLPNIGPKLAEVLCNWVQTNGPLKKIEDLQKVEGLPRNFYHKFLKANLVDRIEI